MASFTVACLARQANNISNNFWSNQFTSNASTPLEQEAQEHLSSLK